MKRWLLLTAGIFLGGCAAAQRPAAPHTQPKIVAAPATLPSRLTLDELPPAPILPTAAPTTEPSQPPLDALLLFAKARDAQLQGQRFSAINLLESAAKIDPNSFELNYALGQAYTQAGASPERAIAAYERAAKIDPNDLAVQAELGRAYQSRGDVARAIDQFRIAMQTDDYTANDPLAAVVDYRLGLALQQKGYDRAALDCYNSLLDRLEHPTYGTRLLPEVNYLLARPDLLYDQIGKLSESVGLYDDALHAYQTVAENSATDFDKQTRVVNVLLKMNRRPEAITMAADLVHRFHASPDSISLLRKTYQDDSPNAFIDALRQLHREHPDDRPILLALADTLAGAGKSEQAQQLLEQSLRSGNSDVEIVQRLYDIYTAADQVNNAASLIVRFTAAHSDTSTELAPLILDLSRMSRKNSLRVSSFAALEVPPDAAAAKQYWLARIAMAWTRPVAARAALQEASHASPPFDPADRYLLEQMLARPDEYPPDAPQTLTNSVESAGRPDLAAELRGLIALKAEHLDEAANQFDRAISQSTHDPSPDLQLERALTVLRQGNAPLFEQLMWKLIGDRPRFGSAYELLLGYYRQNHLAAKATSVVSAWIAADPNSISAQIQLATEQLQSRRLDAALASIRRLFSQRPDDGEVVSAMVLLLNAARQGQDAINLLEKEAAVRPANRTATEALVQIYASQNRMADATRVLDSARAAVANDADQLYYLAHLYLAIGQPQMTENVLQDVLKIDPKNPQAGNDLGYSWVDKGENMDRAEQLIRLAVDAEPDNPAYLDSLGWVLYKRSKFDEAGKYLERAARPADMADPVVLDHLGDAMYRLHRAADAQTAWQQSLTRLTQIREREDLKTLRLTVESKIHQTQANVPASVAPTVENK